MGLWQITQKGVSFLRLESWMLHVGAKDFDQCSYAVHGKGLCRCFLSGVSLSAAIACLL